MSNGDEKELDEEQKNVELRHRKQQAELLYYDYPNPFPFKDITSFLPIFIHFSIF